MRPEDLQTGAARNGVMPDAPVTVVSLQWFGFEAMELTYKTAAGEVANELLFRHGEAWLKIVERGRPSTPSKPTLRGWSGWRRCTC